MAFTRGSQNDRVLKALLEGPKTTAQMQGICGKYTQRISDLRKAGHPILSYRNPNNNGWTYMLGIAL
jgi:hypothetical protein